MGLKITLFVEGFPAILEGAHIVAHPIVFLQMYLQPLLPAVRLVAAGDWTDEILLGLVGLSVVTQVTLRHK